MFAFTGTDIATPVPMRGNAGALYGAQPGTTRQMIVAEKLKNCEGNLVAWTGSTFRPRQVPCVVMRVAVMMQNLHIGYPIHAMLFAPRS